eukprot:2253541-Rhodomonas_salina.5
MMWLTVKPGLGSRACKAMRKREQTELTDARTTRSSSQFHYASSARYYLPQQSGVWTATQPRLRLQGPGHAWLTSLEPQPRTLQPSDLLRPHRPKPLGPCGWQTEGRLQA